MYFLGSPARQFSPSLCDQSRPRTSGASYLQNLLSVPPEPTSTESFLLKGPPSMSEFIQGHRLSKEKRLTVAPPVLTQLSQRSSHIPARSAPLSTVSPSLLTLSLHLLRTNIWGEHFVATHRILPKIQQCFLFGG
uniref:Uncharacterized protein n=1 Tax=Equus caballus TaxID=9796 RepID=A0A9L0S4X7_HORSE